LIYLKMRFITVLAATAASAYSQDICRAVVFSSGDQTASYQAGVLKSLAASGAERVAYNAITGVSGGAVSAGILSSFAEGSESAAADRIVKFW
jgi:predicted acylesterase/phospholipase RssA